MSVFLHDLGAYGSSEQRRDLRDGWAAPTSQQRLDSWTGKMRYMASIEDEENTEPNLCLPLPPLIV